MKIEKFSIQIFIFFCFLFALATIGQEKKAVVRLASTIHYAPNGNSFVLKNGIRKFSIAFYGSNSGYRVETGSLPEFALYIPGTGGNFKPGIQKADKSKWTTTAKTIDSRYALGIMYYKIQDLVLGNGELHLEVISLKYEEGFAAKIIGNNISKDVFLIWPFGEASGIKFSRDDDVGTDLEVVLYRHPNYCINNSFTVQKESFFLEYGFEINKQKTENNKSLIGFYPKSEI